MTAVRALLDPKSFRSAHRRKLRLQAQGLAASGSTDVLILDVSTTGLLLETAGELGKGETIELDIPEAFGVRAVVKWSSGQLFGCEFKDPISIAAVSAVLLRAPYEPPRSWEASVPADVAELADDLFNESGAEGELSFGVKMRWILGLALLSWTAIISAVSLAWRYFN